MKIKKERVILMEKQPKYKVGDIYVPVPEAETYDVQFTIIAVSRHTNYRGEWIYFYEAKWDDGERDYDTIKEYQMKQQWVKKQARISLSSD